MVAFIDVTVVRRVGSLVAGYIHVRKGALTCRSSRWKEVKATAPIACAAELLTLLNRLVSEQLVVVSDNAAVGNPIVFHALSAVFNELPLQPEAWIACSARETVVTGVGDEANKEVATSASICVVYNAIYNADKRNGNSDILKL